MCQGCKLPRLGAGDRRKKLSEVLHYQLKFGKTEKAILMQARQQGQDPLESIKNAPILLPGLEMYLQAYKTLMSCRGGMGDGEIPWTAVMEYGDRYTMNQDETDRLWEVVTRMDSVYLKWRAEQLKPRKK